MLYIIKTSDGEYDTYIESVDAVLEGPSNIDINKLRQLYVDSRPVKTKANGKIYKNGKKDWSETFEHWLGSECKFLRRDFIEILDGAIDE